MPRASRHSLRPSDGNCFISSISSARCRSAMVRKPRCESRSWVAGPTPKMKPTGLSASMMRASSWSSAAKPRGLSRSEAILARNLLQDRPTETVMPISRSTLWAKRASTFAGIMPWTRSVPERSRNASSIDKRFDQRRQRLHGLADLAADADIFRHVGRDHDRGRAERQRLEHRHRRAHAEGAGDVAGRRHHAALAAADDDRPVGNVRIIALLDRGVERVAVDMGDRQRGQGRMPDQARRAAGAAALGGAIEIGKTVPAKAGRAPSPLGGIAHGTSRSQSGSPSAWWAAAMLVGWSCVAAWQSAFMVVSSRITKSSTLRENCGSEAAVRRVCGTNSRLGQESAQPLGIAGDEGQRLNRNDFSDFAGVLNRLFQLARFAFPLTYGL